MPCRIFILILFLAAAGPSGMAASIDLSKPVVESIPQISGIYWNFDETVEPGQMFRDLSGNGNDGTATAGNGALPTLVDGVDLPGVSGFGKAVRLSTSQPVPGPEGNPRVIVNMGVSNSLGFTGASFTGGVWIRFSTIRFGENQTVLLIDKGGFNTKSGENAGHFCLFLVKNSHDAWRAGFQVGDGTENATVYSGPSDLWNFKEGRWYHIGFNFNHDPSAGNTVTFWSNGEKAGTTSVNIELTSGSQHTGARRFFVGERVTTNYVSTFDGEVDDLFVTEGHYDFKPVP